MAHASSSVTRFIRSKMSSGTLGRPSGKRSPCQSGVYLITSSAVKNPCWASNVGTIAAINSRHKMAQKNRIVPLLFIYMLDIRQALLGSNQVVPGTCALRATSSFISTPSPGLSVTETYPFWMISPSFTQFFQRSGKLIQCHSQHRKLGIEAHTCAVDIMPIGDTTQCGASGTK